MRESTTLFRSIILGTLGLTFHALMLIGVDAPDGMLGPRDVLTTPSMLLLGIYALLTGLACVLIRQRRTQSAAALSSTGVMCLLPAYLLVFPDDHGISITGILGSLLQAQQMVRLLSRRDDTRSAPKPVPPRSLPIEAADIDLVLLSGLGALAVALLVSGHHVVTGSIGLAAAWAFMGLTLGFSLPVEFSRFKPTLRRGPYAEHLMLVPVVVCAVTPAWLPALLPVLGLRQIVVASRLWLHERGGRRLWHYLTDRPAQLLVVSFLVAIGCGTVLLSLPAITPGARGLALIDALFTATSATCVTGLIVVDTGTAFTIPGQLILLGMIQIGGLGLMTISTFIALLIGRSIGLRSEFAIGQMIGERRARVALRLLQFIVLLTLTVEAIGAAGLTWAFRASGQSWARSVYLGVFHSVSAFCNAGFSLFPDSLAGFGAVPAVPILVSVLLVLGGLGFGTLFFLLRLPGHHRSLGLHVRLVLTMTAVLALGGTALIWYLEQGAAFAQSSLGGSVLHAWFQSVTARTAGFNTCDLTRLTPATHLVLMILMFVGAAPGSTGGGVKVTTLAVLLLVIRAVLGGRRHVVCANRKVDTSVILNAIALVGLAAVALAAAAVVLLATQPLPEGPLLFEAMSAFGTVGLSLGVTSSLTSVGKVVIVLLMFVGRVGPLTLLIMMQPRRRPVLDHPSANVMIG